jgi:hypothetical protein
MAILAQFLALDLHSCEKVASAILKSQFYASLDIRHSFRAKGLRPKFQKHYTSFWRSSLISFEMVDLILQNSNICVWRSRIAILHQFLPFDLHFVQSCASSKLPVLDIKPSFRAKGRHHATESLHFTARLCVRHTRAAQDKQNWHVSRCLCIRHAQSPHRVTFRWMRPGCPCRQKRESSKNLRNRSFAEVQTQLGHLKLTPVKRFNNPCVTTAA